MGAMFPCALVGNVLAMLDIFDLQYAPMKTRDELATWLASMNVEALARESGISAKTIYRLRHKKHAPTLDTVQALQEAAMRLAASVKPSKAAA